MTVWFVFFLSQTKFICTQLLLMTLRIQLALRKNPTNYFSFLLFSQGWAFTCRAEQDVGYLMSSAVRGSGPSPVCVPEPSVGAVGGCGAWHGWVAHSESPRQMAAPGSSSEFPNLLNNCDL